MGAYALVGVKLGNYTAQTGIFEVDKFIVLDLMNLSKIEVDLKFLRERAEYFCVTEDTTDYDEFGLISTGIFKNNVYASESEFCCCDSEDDLDKLTFDTFDFSENGIVVINDKIIDISEEQFLVYESSITDKLCIVYKPYADKIEMCYKDKEKCHDREYSVFYSVGSNLKFASTLNGDEDDIFMYDIINSSDSEPLTLYNDYVLDTFYELAECRDNVFRIGNVHWVDDWLAKDTFVVENGCQAFFIIAESLNVNEFVLPPSIKIFGSSDEAGLLARKVYLSKALKGSRIVDMVEDNAIGTPSTPDLEIEYY
jgi:hypothetical protein